MLLRTCALSKPSRSNRGLGVNRVGMVHLLSTTIQFFFFWNISTYIHPNYDMTKQQYIITGHAACSPEPIGQSISIQLTDNQSFELVWNVQQIFGDCHVDICQFKYCHKSVPWTATAFLSRSGNRNITIRRRVPIARCLFCWSLCEFKL